MTSAHTGRFLVLLSDPSVKAGVAALRRAAGPRVATTLDVRSGILPPEEIERADAVLFDRLGVALVLVDERDTERTARLKAAAAEESARILCIEPELRVAAYEAPVERLANAAAPGGSERTATWGLQATNVPASTFSGKGIKVAVLDTGFDLKHPDFPSRTVVAKSFVKGARPQDGHGHGTHCIGVACGPKAPWHPPRYGIAYESAIYAGKVLDDNGGGADGGILAGINWAITSGCRVVSMSLGAEVAANTPYSRVFETAAQRALAAGTLIVAAAGNESDRQNGWYAPVGHPANCPSVLAVAAIDVKMRVANFSNRGLNPDGGQVDLAAPGVDVLSAFPMPERERRLSGTSMATPHVAGIAALLAEASPKATATELWALLSQKARRLPLLSTDVGAGRVQAP